jgi:hypothetical protein
MSVILTSWETAIRKMAVREQPKQTVHETLLPPHPPAPISKITTVKWTGGVVQAVEITLCKCEALIQTPVSPKQKTKKKKTGWDVLQWLSVCLSMHEALSSIPSSAK